MMDSITTLSATMTVLLAVFMVLLVVMIWKVMRNEDNDLLCWQFIATKGSDGKHYADLDKLGKLIGIFVASWAMVRVSYSDVASDYYGYAAVMFIYLAFVGAIGGWSAYLRHRGTLPTKGNANEP